MTDELKEIDGYNGQYSVTKDGRIWSHKRQMFLNPWFIKTGYARIGLRDANNHGKRSIFLVHRIVAKTFLENPGNKPEVNHKNGVRDDNRVENLEWATRSENNQHAWDYGNKKFVKSEKHLEAVRKNIVIARTTRLQKLAERKLSHAA